MFDLISIGCISLDTFTQVVSLPRANSESFVVRKYEAHGGGAATVAAYAAFYGGLKTGLVSKIGGDKEGKELVDRIEEYGVSVEGISIENNCSSTIITIIHDLELNRIYLVNLGAVEKLSVQDMPLEYTSNSKLFYIAPAPPKIHKEFIELGVNLNKLIAFNPGSVYFQEGGKKELERLLQFVDFLFVDEQEALEYTNENSARTAGLLLQKRGAKHVIVTRGSLGCMVFFEGQCESYQSKRTERVLHVGGGDVFAAGFLSKMIKVRNIELAATFGNALAAFALSQETVRQHAPNKKRFIDFLK